uniref:ATPase_AAA_core domain-containing protein n=1 Tax=Meloidogyne hapla TaxID=6305 RepID=A0A1I8C091_MELHA
MSGFFNSFQLKKPIKRRWSRVLNSLDCIAPNSEEEIALHPKKLDEGSKTLLLTGPSGSGKRTAVRVIAAELGIEVTEWDWTDDCNNSNNFDKSNKRRSFSAEGFAQFLNDTEFTSIQKMSLKHRLLLISQLPSEFLNEPKHLHQLLASKISRSRCIIVFVMPNVDSCWSLSPFRIFPQSILELLGIEHIKFNPISTSLLINALQRASKKLSNLQEIKGIDIKNIANSSFGDIRRAMNLLFLHYRQQNTKIIEGNSAKRLKTEKLSNNCQQPSTSFFSSNFASSDQLELFHFIGKIMYAKRAEKPTKEWLNNESKLNLNLKRIYGRPLPPKDDLNKLIETSPISAQLLSSYLFEHEPRFGPSIQSISKIQQIISKLDVFISNNYEQRSQMEKYMIDLSVRASLFHNYRPSTGDKQKWRFYQFEKPRLYDLRMQKMEIKSRISALYPIGRTSDMSILLLPLLPRISSICVNQNQAELLEKLSLSSNRLFKFKISENSFNSNSFLQKEEKDLSKNEEEDLIKMTEQLFDEKEEFLNNNNSLNNSFNSFYSISSHFDDDEGGKGEKEENDGFCYEINEEEDEEDFDDNDI